MCMTCHLPHTKKRCFSDFSDENTWIAATPSPWVPSAVQRHVEWAKHLSSEPETKRSRLSRIMTSALMAQHGGDFWRSQDVTTCQWEVRSVQMRNISWDVYYKQNLGILCPFRQIPTHMDLRNDTIRYHRLIWSVACWTCADIPLPITEFWQVSWRAGFFFWGTRPKYGLLCHHEQYFYSGTHWLMLSWLTSTTFCLQICKWLHGLHTFGFMTHSYQFLNIVKWWLHPQTFREHHHSNPLEKWFSDVLSHVLGGYTPLLLQNPVELSKEHGSLCLFFSYHVLCICEACLVWNLWSQSIWNNLVIFVIFLPHGRRFLRFQS